MRPSLLITYLLSNRILVVAGDYILHFSETLIKYGEV